MDDGILILGPGGRSESNGRAGRPRAAEPGERLCVWLRVSDYDRLVQLANRHEMSVSALVRSLLLVELRSGSRFSS